MSDIDSLRHLAGMVRGVVLVNLEGISHDESLVHPRPAGNNLNWVLGHLLSVYDQLLPLLGGEPVMGGEALRRYVRGSPPLADPADALPLDELVRAWDEACARIDAGLAALPPERLAEPAPDSPTDNPDETIGSLLRTVMFHQAYHAGQLGVLRRVAGKKGAIP